MVSSSFSSAVFFFFTVLLCHGFPVKPQTLHRKPDNIFILAGQSNMAGRGGVVNDTETNAESWDGIVPSQSQPNPSILRLDAKLRWVLAQEPIHHDIDWNKTNGVGPGMSFANAVLSRDPNIGVIGLVPCAIGGTNISEWSKGRFLYKQMMKRAKVGAESGGVIRAVLWYQGESDTDSHQNAVLYKSKLEKFFMNLRSDLRDPMLPIIQVALASGVQPQFVEIVREAQLGSDVMNVRTVDAKPLPIQSDGLHLTTSAQVQLGEMMADAFLRSIPTRSSPIRFKAASHSSTTVLNLNVIYLLFIIPLLNSLCTFLTSI